MRKLLGSMIVLVFILVGCGSSNTQEVSIGGSTSVQNLMEDMMNDYMAEFPDVTITYDGQGSSAGVEGATNGTYQIGTASREIKDSEKVEGLSVEVLAFDGIALVVHPDNKVLDLTMDQVRDIYTGKVTNWSEIDGTDGQIAVISRDSKSGTRGAFEEIVGFNSSESDPMISSALEIESNGGVVSNVAGNQNAIGYISFDSIDESVVPIKVDGSQATSANVAAGAYAISRPFNMVYNLDKTNETLNDFINWVKTNIGKYIEDHGLIAK